MSIITDDGSLLSLKVSYSVADDASIDLVAGKSGWGFVQAGDNEEYGAFTFTTAGVVTLLTDISANVVATDTDAKLCIFDGGAFVSIRNRLGSAKVLKVLVNYA